MQTYNFPNFLISDEYPASSTPVTYGGGWEFVSKPAAPDQITFVLSYPGMWIYPNAARTGLDLTKNPTRNFGLLMKFYEDHRMYEKFSFPHPYRGTVTVRFKDPLVTPNGVAGGNGLLEPFQIKLRLQP